MLPKSGVVYSYVRDQNVIKSKEEASGAASVGMDREELLSPQRTVEIVEDSLDNRCGGQSFLC